MIVVNLYYSITAGKHRKISTCLTVRTVLTPRNTSYSYFSRCVMLCPLLICFHTNDHCTCSQCHALLCPASSPKTFMTSNRPEKQVFFIFISCLAYVQLFCCCSCFFAHQSRNSLSSRGFKDCTNVVSMPPLNRAEKGIRLSVHGSTLLMGQRVELPVSRGSTAKDKSLRCNAHPLH